MLKKELLFNSIDTIRASLSNSSQRKAERIFSNDGIFNVSVPHSTAGTINGSVRGDHSIYDVVYKYNNEMDLWEHECSCPTRRRYCSHILAFLLYLSSNYDSLFSQPQDRLNDYLNSYSNDRCNLPIRGLMFGLEVEFYGITSIYSKRLELFWKHNHLYVKELLNRGWKLKNDNSVDFEMVSAISSKESLLTDFKDFPDLWEYWSANTNDRKAGIHVHCSMDDVFAVGKKPLSETKEFLKNLAIYLEENLIKDSATSLFGRNYTSYCGSWKEGGNPRYKWINFLPLDRNISKTIEIRIFSSSMANRIPEVIEKSYWLAILFRRAIVQWRKDKRPNFEDWIRDRKLLQMLFTNKEIVQFFKVFRPEFVKIKSL